MSGDPEHDHFADGMTEEIITALSRSSGLFVIARAVMRLAPYRSHNCPREGA
jgi:TolB-like protein